MATCGGTASQEFEPDFGIAPPIVQYGIGIF